jgi:hypothetical protein
MGDRRSLVLTSHFSGADGRRRWLALLGARHSASPWLRARVVKHRRPQLISVLGRPERGMNTRNWRLLVAGSLVAGLGPVAWVRPERGWLLGGMLLVVGVADVLVRLVVVRPVGAGRQHAPLVNAVLQSDHAGMETILAGDVELDECDEDPSAAPNGVPNAANRQSGAEVNDSGDVRGDHAVHSADAELFRPHDPVSRHQVSLDRARGLWHGENAERGHG